MNDKQIKFFDGLLFFLFGVVIVVGIMALGDYINIVSLLS